MQAEQQPILELRHLHRLFGSPRKGVRAVQDVSLSVQPRNIVSVVGESGSGKTTLSRLILGLLPATSGEILFRGQKIRPGRAYWQKVQGIFQDPFASFNQFFSVEQSLKESFHALPEKLSATEKTTRFEEALDNVNLSPHEIRAKYPFELSGGQMQRLLIARALLIKPELLIADEPTSMIDACCRANTLELLMGLNRKTGMTIIFITHDVGLAYYVSDEVFIMRNGQIVEHGSADEVVFNPQNPYTQQLIGDVPAISRPWLTHQPVPPA